MSPDAHKISFNIERENAMNKISYALLVTNDNAPCCYATVIELDKDAAYMQHGGAFPSVEKSIYTSKGYFMCINWLKEHYKSISTRVFNGNIPMIKLHLAGNFLINGLDANDGDIYLNFNWKKC